MSGHVCVYIWVCFCAVHTVYACDFASSSAHISFLHYLYLFVFPCAIVSKSFSPASRPSELTVCTFSPVPGLITGLEAQ